MVSEELNVPNWYKDLLGWVGANTLGQAAVQTYYSPYVWSKVKNVAASVIAAETVRRHGISAYTTGAILAGYSLLTHSHRVHAMKVAATFAIMQNQEEFAAALEAAVTTTENPGQYL